jgi:predicted phage terminase large subunit-like protein
MVSQEVFDALCRQNLSVFFQRAWRELEPSDYEHNWHIDCIAAHLEAVERGEIKRLIINVPPRTGKTLLVNIIYTAWLLGRNSGTRVLGVSYAHRLSEKIAYQTRLLMETEWYRRLFPKTILDQNQQQKSNFLTTQSGGRFSTSVGGTITGEGGDYIIIDDPQNPEEALSDVKRVSSNEWTDHAIYSRLNNPKEGRIVVIMQRLHSEDTTGHLLAKGGWHLLKLPAVTDKKIEIKLGDKTWSYDKFLHEKRLDASVLDSLRSNMSDYAFVGQYLQEPVPIGGGEFKSDYLKYYASSVFSPVGGNLYITVDPATAKKKTSDFTAMAVWALMPDQNYYLIDGIRERLNPTERVDRLFQLHRKWLAKTKRPAKVGWEVYGMMSDIHYIEQKQREENYRFPIIEIRSKLQKEDRIRRLIAPLHHEQVWMPNDIFIKNDKGLPINFISDIVEKEMLLFPYAAHDDFLDAMSMIFDMNPIFPSLGSVSRQSGSEMYNDNSISVFDV